MCGIVGIWMREGVFTVDHLDLLFKEAEKRGQDGFGIYIINNKPTPTRSFCTFTESYTNKQEEALEWLDQKYRKGVIRKDTLILANFRAHPETEVASSWKNIQPIRKEKCILSHNGAVANSIVKEVEKDSPYETKIDSEAIINTYLHFNRNIKQTMEYLVGGFAFLLYDETQNRLHCVTDFKPLSIAYVRGYGLVLHSQEDALQKLVNNITDCTRCGTNVWEDFYFHPQEGYQIRSIDLDSGMERLKSYTPRIYHPEYNKLNSNDLKPLVLVSTSGGIDSGLTAHALKKLDYDVEMIHFKYGQKSEEAELWAIKKLSKTIDCKLKVIDVKDIFSEDPSQLINNDQEITTGTKDDIKTTSGWCSNRNGVFLSILTSLAEQRILKGQCSNVLIASGMSNLSESGFYPDNSESFIRAFFESIRYSTLTWPRIKYISVFQNIMKAEEWLLGNEIGFPFEYTCSCDCAKLDPLFDSIWLCRQCGSTLLSIWAAEMAGVFDPRKFYDRNVNISMMEKPIKGKTKHMEISDIVKRMLLPSKQDYIKMESVLKKS